MECSACGKEIESTRKRKYCADRDCIQRRKNTFKRLWYRIFHNPNPRKWSRIKTERLCLCCGRSFIAERPRIKYCTISCASKANWPNNIAFRSHHGRKVRFFPVIRNCPVCGKEFIVKQNSAGELAKGTRKTCSPACKISRGSEIQRIWRPTCLHCNNPFLPRKGPRNRNGKIRVFCGSEHSISHLRSVGLHLYREEIKNFYRDHGYQECAKSPNGPYIRESLRREIFRRDDYVCQLCRRPVDTLPGSHPTKATIDHIKPRFLGVDNRKKNLPCLCFECNSSQGAVYGKIA